MRYVKDIMLEQAVLHTTEHGADEPILSDNVLAINEDVEEYCRKHTVKLLNSVDTFNARFFSDKSVVQDSVRKVIDDPKQFLKESRVITTKMFNEIKHSDIPGGDILMIGYIADEQRCFAILKLDYQRVHTHNIIYCEDDLNVLLNPTESGLPTLGQTVKKAAFFTKGPENSIEMIVINKSQSIEEGNENYFVEDFLEAVFVKDDTQQTRKFKNTVEKWTIKNLMDQIEAANTVREITIDSLVNEAEIVVDDIAENMFSEVPEIKESFLESMSDAGYLKGTKFHIDKTYISNSMKSRQIKTDTGVLIRADHDFFRDTQKLVVKRNGDGTVDYIIKNVRNVVER